MTHLVTGGAGFIGSNIVRALLQEGSPVRVLDNFSTGHLENLAGLTGVEVIEGDVRDADTVRRACAGIEVVFHEAAVPSVPKSVKDPWTSNSNNLDGTLQLLIAARDQKVRRVIYAASSSAYGNTPTLPKVETMPATPLSPYAVAKYASELYARVFTQVYGLETILLRYFNIFGPRQDPSSPYSGVISRFIAGLSTGEQTVIFGDGRQSRDFTYIANAVQANLKARTHGTPGEVYNVGTGHRSDLIQVHDILAKLIGSPTRPRFEAARAGDVRDSLADISKARRDLGYEPTVMLEAGLQQTVAWFQTQATAQAQAGTQAGAQAR